ncbi:hypothetical protein [Halomonas sp. LBP4]|uniref:hypothetical protein n=1 Tax=Halomonas sp. LBP4 TaxID=2044917 RepID=UPI0011B4B471|nr:hypothetical protein [Halomonas sp. LBP4]
MLDQGTFLHRSSMGVGRRLALASLLLGLTTSASGETPRLSEHWLSRGSQPDHPAFAYYLRRDHLEPHRRQALRLREELVTLANRMKLDGQPSVANALTDWQTSVDALYRQGSRTPARADLTALLASPRHDPRLSTLAAVGQCEPPDWVELWTFGGVTRRPWSPGLTLPQALRDQPDGHWRAAAEAWVVGPQSPPRRLGIAAWNAESSPLVPGSRVALLLPDESLEADWVNRTLPEFLATRLPGDACDTLDPTDTDIGQTP